MITYNPIGDDVPLSRTIVFQFSKSRLFRELQKFPRNLADEGGANEKNLDDIV